MRLSTQKGDFGWKWLCFSRRNALKPLNEISNIKLKKPTICEHGNLSHISTRGVFISW
jgi:hypothetical protein